MVKKNNNKMIFIIIGAVVLLMLFGNSLNNSSNSQGTYNSNNQNYYCCSSANGYSCSLNVCPFGSSKVYTGSFDTLTNCNNKCVTPQKFPEIVNPVDTSTPLTCAQIAQQNNAYFTEQFNDAKACMDYAVLDCQDKGKQIDGYGLQGTCCYYTCAEVIPQLTCSDSDGGVDIFNFGTCGDNSGTPYIEDYCIGGALMEQSCVDNKCVAQQTACPQGTVCDFGRCVAI